MSLPKTEALQDPDKIKEFLFWHPTSEHTKTLKVDTLSHLYLRVGNLSECFSPERRGWGATQSMDKKRKGNTEKSEVRTGRESKKH